MFSRLYDTVMRWSAHRHASRYLGGLSFAESSFFPIPPDVMLAPMSLARPDRAWRYALLTCERRCLLDDGRMGWCRTRVNHAGRLITLAHGAVPSLSADPIEKKPLYHFYPGSVALTAQNRKRRRSRPAFSPWSWDYLKRCG